MKNRVKFIVVLLFLLNSFNFSAQKITPFNSWNTQDLSKANSARTLKDIYFQEKKVVFFINLARMNGNLFVETYLKDYIEDVRVPRNKYYRSLIRTLKEQTPLTPLLPQDDLFKEAIKHAKEMGRTGKKGHSSANHQLFEVRMRRFKKKYKKMKESNQYGFPDALSIVINLLIDDDVEALTHRRSLLHKDLKYVGVGIRSHKKYQINTCILFGGDLIEPN